MNVKKSKFIMNKLTSNIESKLEKKPGQYSTVFNKNYTNTEILNFVRNTSIIATQWTTKGHKSLLRKHSEVNLQLNIIKLQEHNESTSNWKKNNGIGK